ncbi:unnamed protein product [Polarella glacialis]|uniref:Methyltransferase type 11 domain-containing protein n=1 Tax=Polarella glacialis TaxID=89957 RepID=A0A813DMF8_POLGL|nr:unnamed protein product [Polarella glacialis]
MMRLLSSSIAAVLATVSVVYQMISPANAEATAFIGTKQGRSSFEVHQSFSRSSNGRRASEDLQRSASLAVLSLPTSSGRMAANQVPSCLAALLSGAVSMRFLSRTLHGKRQRKACSKSKLPRGVSYGSSFGSSFGKDSSFKTVSEEVQRGVKVAGFGKRKFKMPMAITSSPVAQVFDEPCWPDAWPYTEADFARRDEKNDADFFQTPMLGPGLDQDASGALSFFHTELFKQAGMGGQSSILDLGSSFESNYPTRLNAKRVTVLGMNQRELELNPHATERIVQDLNQEPCLPFGDAEFDFVTMSSAVQYLTQPQKVFSEMSRVLKPGGVASVAFSHRCWASKAIEVWHNTIYEAPGQCRIVGNYFHFNPPQAWLGISALDLSPTGQGWAKQCLNNGCWSFSY